MPLLGLSTDSMTERELAEEAIRRSRHEVGAFSAAALCGQDELVDELADFARHNRLAIFFHALDLDIAGIDPVDHGAVRQLAEYARALGSPWITTDFAMWVWRGEKLIENMVPMPLTREAVDWVSDRVQRIQDILQMPLVGENPPYTCRVMSGDLDILPVMAAIAERADCGLCMDIGHLYILRQQRDQPLRLPADDDFPWHRVVEGHISSVAPRRYRSYEVVQDQHRWPVDESVWRTTDVLLPRLESLRTLIGESEGMTPDDLVEKLDVMGDRLEGVQW